MRSMLGLASQSSATKGCTVPTRLTKPGAAYEQTTQLVEQLAPILMRSQFFDTLSDACPIGGAEAGREAPLSRLKNPGPRGCLRLSRYRRRVGWTRSSLGQQQGQSLSIVGLFPRSRRCFLAAQPMCAGDARAIDHTQLVDLQVEGSARLQAFASALCALSEKGDESDDGLAILRRA
jgi:hypothetical protein